MSTVWRDKKRTAEVIHPQFGQTGFREGEGSVLEQVYFDKGGTGRTAYKKDEARTTFEMKPAWVTAEEFRERKDARARFWKKSREGQRDYVSRKSSPRLRDSFGRWELPGHAW
jgi:hypothetical protein